MVKYLLDNQYQKADAKMTDSQGNTVLHALVMVAVNKTDKSKENTKFITDIYDQILETANRLHPKLKLEDMENHSGLTPLKLAAKTGKTEVKHHRWS